MKCIGRIVTNSKTVDTLDYVEVTNNKCGLDFSVPTLIIGKKNAVELFGEDNIKVLDRKIKDNVYWTYGKTEKRNIYEEDLRKFNQNLIKNLSKKVKYTFFNVLSEPLSRIKRYIKFMRSDEEKIVYITDNHVYIFYNNNVFGLSLDDIEYAGIKKEKVIKQIQENPHNIVIDNTKFLSKKMKNYIKDDKILVPYLYFIAN